MILNWHSRGPFLILFLVLFSSSCSDPMEHAHCEDTEIKRVKAPHGKLVAVIYSRSCSGGSGLYTYAEVEDPSEFILWPPNRHPEVCFLVTLAGGYHQMDVVWNDDKHITVSSTDELDNQGAISSQHVQCNDIQVAYDFRFAPPPLKEAPDKETIETISTAISETEKCVGKDPEHTERLRALMKDRQHGDALEWLCTYLKNEHCPISKDVLSLIQQAATYMRSTKMSCYHLEDQNGSVISH